MRTPPSLRAWAEGALVMAALVPWAVVSGLYGVVFLSSLAGYNSKGEEGETVLVAVLLGGVSVAACVVAAHMVANRTRLSSVGGFAVAGMLTIAWAALIPSLWSSGIPLISGLPWAITMMILTGFTVPVAILGFVGLITVAVVRRVRHRTVEELRTSGARLG